MMTKRVVSFFVGIFFVINLLISPIHVFAEVNVVEAKEVGEVKEVDDKELNSVKTLCEGLIPRLLEKYHIAGATVSVVREGKLVFKDGYGFYDMDHEKRVSPNSTLFRIGSITKLFTWTAVMQLVEQGKIDLDRDINEYLTSFKINNTFLEPITMRQLMTHTAGFEDRLNGLFQDPNSLEQSLGDYLKDNQPNRIYKPGEIIAYSNYGAALAGLIVEQVSGKKYEEYIQDNIFKPLEMDKTLISQRASNTCENETSYGFKYAGGEMKPFKDAMIKMTPTGAISSTAEDISKFMIMHLQKGQYQDIRIISEESAKEMQRQQYTSDSRIPGICLGFMEWNRNGKHILWHSGGSELFKSLFMFIPDNKTGLFISFNSPNSEEARSEFRQAFLDTFFPYENQQQIPLSDYKERAKSFEGNYMEGRTALHNSDKLIFAASRYKKVSANTDGTINFRDTRYMEVEPYVFREVNGQGILIFHHDDKGNITHAFQDFEPHEAYIKIPWYQSIEFQGVIFLLCIFIFLVPVVVWPLMKRYGKRSHQYEPKGTMQIGCSMMKIMCILNLMFLVVAILGIVLSLITNPRELETGNLPTLTKLSLLLPVAGALFDSVVLIYTVYAWKNHIYTLFFRLQYTVCAIAGVIFTFWLKYWNLLGFYI